MLNVIDNKTSDDANEVIAVTRRVNNNKRNYLLLNTKQAKYIPVTPDVPLAMFDRLAEQVLHLRGNIIVIGFAETATAIGARVAYQLAQVNSEDVTYLTTTREEQFTTPICEFKEEHSHAVEQLLYGDEKLFKRADLILFVEDELTTGNTIMNCVKQLKEKYKCKYAAASILNCMDVGEQEKFRSAGIDLYWLIQTDKSGMDTSEPKSNFINYAITLPNPRTGVNPQKYADAIRHAAWDIGALSDKHDNILLIGTEECMYPAIMTADYIMKLGHSTVEVTSTTRVHSVVEGPLQNCTKVFSCYGRRSTYVYNLHKVDCAVIMTDGRYACIDLANILFDTYGVRTVIMVQIKEDTHGRCENFV